MRLQQGERVLPCVVAADGCAYDVSSLVADWVGSSLDPRFLRTMEQEIGARVGSLTRVEIADCRVLPPFVTTQILSIGLNYADHISESGMEAPPEPILSGKSYRSLAGANDPIILPPNSSKVDWEVELGVVIGRRAQYLESVSDSVAHIAGYCTANDLSERDWLLHRNGQWLKGKSCESFSPVGPWLVTSDAVDPGDLSLTCVVNGVVQQSSRTSHMRFSVDYLVHYVSQFMTLEPGDLILTGSPGGMALGRPDPRYLRADDVVETEVEGLGRMVQVCRDYQHRR